MWHWFTAARTFAGIIIPVETRGGTTPGAMPRLLDGEKSYDIGLGG